MANLIVCNVVMFTFGVMMLVIGLRAGTWNSGSKPFKITGLVVGLMSIAAVIFCTVGYNVLLVKAADQERYDQQKMDEAKVQLMDWYQRLPQIEGFSTLSTTIDVGYSLPDNSPCYEAEANSIIGVTSTVTDALNVYSDALRTLRWAEPSKQYEIEREFDAPATTNVGLVIDGIEPWWLEHDPTFQKWKRSNRGILFLRLHDHYC